MDLSVHPVAKIFPLMSDAELRDLGADIKAHGQLEPIWLFEGAIVDGRNRYDACCLHEIEPRVRELPPDTDLLAFVLGKNLHRRQLNESQRAIVAAEIATFRRGEKKADFENGEKKPQKHRENNGSAKRAHGPISENEEKKTIEEAAETVGVGPRTVKRAKKVIANAPAEVVETIKAGEATVRDAESVAQESKEVQAKAAGKVKTKAAKTLKEAVAQVKEEEPPQSEEPTTDWPVDELGIPIQGHALKAFEAVPLFQELEALLKKARKLYGQLADLPGGIFLTRPGVSINSSERWKHKGLEDCLSAVQDSRPAYTVCPWTVNKLVNPEAQFDHEADCYLCKGLNWSRPVRKSEPAHSLLEKLKEVHGV